MRIQILDLAKADLFDGHEFYEKQEAGLGDYFLRSLFSDIDQLQSTAGIHLQPYRHFHRALSERFPFAIFYGRGRRGEGARRGGLPTPPFMDSKASSRWLSIELE